MKWKKNLNKDLKEKFEQIINWKNLVRLHVSEQIEIFEIKLSWIKNGEQ